MHTANDCTRLVDDLAGRWTEPALEILKAAGTQPITVDTELAVWRVLRKVLDAELHRRRAFKPSSRMDFTPRLQVSAFG